MAIPSFHLQKNLRAWTLTVLAGTFTTLAYGDRITMTNGAVQEGKVSAVQNGTVTIQASNGSFPIPLTSILKVQMDPPSEFNTAMTTADPKTAISLLEPIIPNYKGIPAIWIPQAMSRLVDCYLATTNYQKANEEILDLQQAYPTGVGDAAFQHLVSILALTGQAKVSLRSGSPENALASLNPLIAEFDKVLIASPDQARQLAPLCITEGQIYEAMKKPTLALECYLKVKAILYRDPSLAASVDKYIADLKKANPNVAVD